MTRIYITADQLQRGDVALHTESKARWFAAFDLSVEIDWRTGPTQVRAWTAVTDQDNGVARTLDFGAKATLLVERDDDRRPQVTHTVLTYQADGSVAVDRH